MQSTQCSFDGCVKPVKALTLCSGHYERKRVGKKLEPLKHHITGTLQERLDAQTDKTGNCWIWTGGISPRGYGVIGVGNRHKQAHRVAYENEHGPIPAGMMIDHTCYTRACVNPAHLQAVTPGQNNENRSGPNKNNTSGVRGVYWNKPTGNWRATVGHNGGTYQVGYFANLADAEAAVKKMRLRLHSNASEKWQRDSPETTRL